MNSFTLRIHGLKYGTALKVIQVFCASLLLSLFCLPAFSQLNYGRIYGAITDQTGGAIVGATVTVVDVARGISRPLTADAAGEYSAPSLLPGTYTVRAEAMGFQVSEHAGIILEVGQDLRVDLSLQPGAQTQTITVTGDLPMVNTSNATLGATLENQSIADLPLNGRAFQKLLDYSPGMQAIPGGSTPTYSSNGVRAMNNDWMLDGVDEINMTGGSGPVVGGNGGGVDGINILSLDAIQEINIIENPKAEYGWKPGATVNVGLKSGTNNIHGTAFAFGRDGAMDARNPFLTSNESKATDNLTQYGASIGGPIKKDKLFYFATYERQRYTLGAPRTITEPTDADLGSVASATANSIPDAIAAINQGIALGTTFIGSATPIALDGMSLRMAGCNPNSPNITSTNGATVATACSVATSLFGNATGSAVEPVQFNNVGGSDNVLGKVDYHPDDHNSFNSEYFIGNGHVDNATAATQPYWLNVTHIRSQVVRAIWVWTPNSTWLNEMRFGYLKYSQLQYPSDCTLPLGQPNYAMAYGYDLGVTVPSPQCGFPNLTISGGGVTDNTLGVTGSAGGGQDNSYGVWSGVDSVSYTHGKHLFKFGGEIHATRLNGNLSVTNDTGVFTFGGSVPAFTNASALQDFLTGVPATAAILLGNPNRLINYSRYAGFVQDDWRATSRVTVNLGVRYENVPALVELNNQLGNFDPAAPSGLIQQTNGHTVYKNPNDLFSPRLGIAWDVTGKGTTVVRAGGSYMYNLVTMTNLLKTPQGAQLNAIPTGWQLVEPNGTAIASPGDIAVGTKTLTGTATNSPIPWAANTPIFDLSGPSAGLSCGNGLGTVNLAIATNPTTNPANPGPCSIAGVQPNEQAAAVATWNLSIQHAITNNLSLNVAYVGTHGLHLPGVIDLNMPAPGAKNGSSSPSNETEQLRRPYTENCPVSEGGLGLGGPCFPYLGQIQQESADLISNYNALQMALQQRISHGLIFTAGYTLAHTLDDNSNETANQVMDSNNPNLDYGNATIDARSHFTLTGTYAIPSIKSPGQILEGWEVNGAVTFLSALPFNADDTSDDISGTGENLDRWDMSGPANGITAGGVGTIPCYGVVGSSFANAGCVTVATVANLPSLCQSVASSAALSPVGTGVPTTAAAPVTGQVPIPQNTATYSLARLGCYYENGTAIAPPAQGTFGTMARNALRGHPFRETDISVTKNWKFKERYTAQFRAEFFNILNDPEYAAPSGNLAAPATFGVSQSTPNTSSLIFGNGGPRTVQLGLKVIF